MDGPFRVRGRDVLFCHWPVDPGTLRPHVPDALALDTRDGEAWLGLLAFEAASAGVDRPFVPSLGPFTQLTLRTYVSVDGEPAVYFLALDAGSRLAALAGRHSLRLPFHAAEGRVHRRGDRVRFRSRRRGADPPADFVAEYRPVGEEYNAEPGSLAYFLVERKRYAMPVDDSTDGGAEFYVGAIDRAPWRLRDATARLHRTTFARASGVAPPDAAPTLHYSPGFETRASPPRRRRLGAAPVTRPAER